MASAIEAGGTSGGWTHVTEVASGLRKLGHDVRVITRAPHQGPRPRSMVDGGPLRLVQVPQQVALAALPAIARDFRRFRPDVVMERFYNFAGAGVLLAHRHYIPSILEVNAPMVDPPGSMKTRVDTLLLGILRRWAVRQARWSAAIVTPLASTVPPEVARRKICQLPWGANVQEFDPAIRDHDPERLHRLATELGLDTSVPAAVFMGSFRSWHGAGHFAEAARRLLLGGADLAFMAIGGGPELEYLRHRVADWDIPPGRFVFTGPQPHERIPDLLALADIGVAPFDLSAHAPLTTFGFYWSPLKVFEYMSMALPVITIDVNPLNEIVRDEREGLLYPSGDIGRLSGSLSRLAADPALRERLGGGARIRVVERYSWQAHCLALDSIIRKVAHAA